jgi:hypothetical protein
VSADDAQRRRATTPPLTRGPRGDAAMPS